MIQILKIVKSNISQLVAIIEKNLAQKLRYKINVIIGFISPIISLIMPLVVMNQIFSYNVVLGTWDGNSFMVYVFLGYNVNLIRGLINTFSGLFLAEKNSQTLPNILIAPFNRFNLLFGTICSHLIYCSIPFYFFIIICYLIDPISIITLICVLIIFISISLIFSGIGIILGAFAISKQQAVSVANFLLSLFFFTSCISFPFEIFPIFLQEIIYLNPFYHIFWALRVTWMENNILFSLSIHPRSFLVLIGGAIIFPVIGMFLFNIIYKKFGIVLS